MAVYAHASHTDSDPQAHYPWKYSGPVGPLAVTQTIPAENSPKTWYKKPGPFSSS